MNVRVWTLPGLYKDAYELDTNTTLIQLFMFLN